MNFYQQTVKESLPRLINCYNLDPFSDTLGMADRQYWGWKTIDFSNATLQGGIHTLAIAYRTGLYDDLPTVLRIMERFPQSIRMSCSARGGLAEAYPNENSFCVTALVAFDALSSLKILNAELPDSTRHQMLEAIEGLVQFISHNDEEHAIISNHLATGVAAITLWNEQSGSSSTRGEELLEVILSHQSNEGWYREYEGADPGYQTLALYYLEAAQKILNDPQLEESMDQSLEFLQYCLHPDGSIGGLYGSRNTEVFYPGGLVSLSSRSSIASSIVAGFENGIQQSRPMLPQDIDVGNYVPLLNSFAFAALSRSEETGMAEVNPLPWEQEFEKDFVHGGMYIKSNRTYYSIVNYKKGGTLKVFDKSNRQLDVEDGGLVGTLNDGVKFSTQSWNDDYSFDGFTVNAGFYRVNEEYPGPFQFLVLRILALTVLRNSRLGNWFKKMVVRRLMTGKKKIDGSAERQFEFNDREIRVKQQVHPPRASRKILQGGKFKAIHMASSGYNFMDRPAEGTVLVKFESHGI